ncbi:zinc finger CCCH domain-containing protein 11A isoform X2 [Hypomesus transpacificus]|uniref:zinc finger CCCH domain-containing protein 11A isoform X2 n=1 Tax=Hypomesus transpacificus TaxID=137520 RepID=UPI001F07ECA3|nr:zinc finger CCCH domain-containing protein 11A isoform X2 [Hypomesus transpacificus]
MTNNGDDCYFFYYSTCTKGDSCPFRHCQAAMGSETVCSLWQEGRCFRMVCKFRHMEIKKNRREIACYWENQPAGCQKSHCAFHHEKPRFIDGHFVPADKGSASKEVEQPQEEPAPPPPPAPLPSAANPQLRGVIKAETQESVPSPTHPPVVINPADDDEDEDDQCSEDETSPRKLAKVSSSDDSMNFGIRTLEEIRLRRALKASMKRYGTPLEKAPLSCQVTNGGGKEESMSLYGGPALFSAISDVAACREVTGRRNVADRLGKRIHRRDDCDLPLKRCLAARLGGVVGEDEGNPSKDCLTAEPRGEPEKAPPEIHIKTLEEIRLAKAAKSPNLKTEPPITTTATKTSPKVSKRSIMVKTASIVQVKTFSEVLHAKKKLQKERLQKTKSQSSSGAPSGSPSKGLAEEAVPGRGPPPRAGVRVKTLEEIRCEKAARMQAKCQGEDEGEAGGKAGRKPQLPRIRKPSSPEGSSDSQKSCGLAERPGEPTITTEVKVCGASGNGVKVKTFQEIMREKQLRRQEDLAASNNPSDSSVEAETARSEPPAIQRKVRVLASPSGSSSPRLVPELAPTIPNAVPVGQRVLLSPKVTPPTVTTATSPQWGPPPKLAESSSPAPGRRGFPVPSQEARGVAPPALDSTLLNQDGAQHESPAPATGAKVRPKLNVKPSVVKPAAEVKPGQKRKAAESAVAAVKPLNSASRAHDNMPSKRTAVSLQVSTPSSPQMPAPPALGPSPGFSPLEEELQASHTLNTVLPSNTAACSVPQSPVTKVAGEGRSRRLSLATSSGLDTFEDLMNEFTDNLEDEQDRGKAGDDLLRELSEMIDN